MIAANVAVGWEVGCGRGVARPAGEGHGRWAKPTQRDAVICD